jgi:thioredoxin-related protein
LKLRTLLSFLLCLVLPCGIAVAQSTPAPDKNTVKASYVPVREYDPKRDATKDIADAVKEAQRGNKNVLIEIGGQWCIWCKYFDKFFADQPSLAHYRDENYVLVKVNFSKENENKQVISKYGKIPGYPHLFVLDKSGKLLHSQETSKLEEGRGYNMAAVANFLRDWAPTSKKATN